MVYPGLREFRLAGPEGNGRDPYVNENGAFIGRSIPLLHRGHDGSWRPRSKSDLEIALSKVCSGPVDIGTRLSGLNVVANALNKRDYALANIALVLLRFPVDIYDGIPQNFQSNNIYKYNPREPRLPAGVHGGGQWTNGGILPDTTSSSQQNSRLNADHSIVPAAYNGEYHDLVVIHMAIFLAEHGNLVEINVPFTTVDGKFTAIADIVLSTKAPGAFFILEIKTGDDPTFTLNQAIVYPMAAIGQHVYSSSWKIKTFGFAPGAPLPPIEVMQVYATPGKELEVKPLIPEYKKWQPHLRA